MKYNILVAVPAYRDDIKGQLGEALANLRIACMISEVQAAQKPQGKSDRFLIPSATPPAFHWLGRGYGNSCDLALNRNSFVQTALDMGAHWLLMVDSDTWQMDPLPVLRMMHDGWARDAATIAAPVRRRDMSDWYNFSDGDQPATTVTPDVREVTKVGTAFMAVNIPWVARNWRWDENDPWFQFKPTTQFGKPHHVSEDFWFCGRLKAHGGTLLLDGRFEPTHADVAARSACPTTKAA